MSEVPKIVYERLRGTGTPDGAHPDSNLLAAFAEQALSAAERERVVQHLVQCAECREAIALSLPALEAAPELAREAVAPAARVSIARGRTWFAWNRLGWVGLAAGVLIAVGVFVMRPGGEKKVTEAQQRPAATVAPQTEKAEADKSPATRASSSEVTTTAENRPEAPAPPATPLRNEMKKLAVAAVAPKKELAPPPQVSAQSAGANPGHSLDKDVQGGLVAGASMPRPQSANETVEVTAEAPVNTETAQTTDTLAASEAAPVMRAKAARAQEAATSTAEVKQQVTVSNVQDLKVSGRNMSALRQPAPEATQSAAPAQWVVHGDKVQRSVDSDGRWATVFQHRNLLFVAASGIDVWAGGKNGDLFHSADLGATWTQVRPSLAGQTLADDVTHIEVHSPTQVVLTTSKNEAWSTTDGGKTWTRK